MLIKSEIKLFRMLAEHDRILAFVIELQFEGGYRL
jgi:hypothetical protein